jgi:hypothetical protein
MNIFKYIILLTTLTTLTRANNAKIYILEDAKIQNGVIALKDSFFVALKDDLADPVSNSYSALEKKMAAKKKHSLPMTPELFWVCIIDDSEKNLRIISVNFAKGFLQERFAVKFSDKKIVLREEKEADLAFLDKEFSDAVLKAFKKAKPLEWQEFVSRAEKSTGQRLSTYYGLKGTSP